MLYECYPHRFSDIILNSDYALRQEIETIVKNLDLIEATKRFDSANEYRKAAGRKISQGKQSTINLIFKEQFGQFGWTSEKNVFDESGFDLVMDFWKRDIGVDVAFNHRSFLGGDLLRLQAAAEIKNIIKVGVYICATKELARTISSKDGLSMVTYERAKWYLENFYSILTVPILLIGLKE